MADQIALQNRMLRMTGNFSNDKVFLKNARVDESFSQITETRIEFLSSDKDLDLQDFIGTNITLEFEDEDKDKLYFSGHCISVEYIGLYQGLLHMVAEVRPWLWFLTKTTDNRIFQEKTVVEIITEVLSDHGFSSDLVNKLSGTYKSRTYCVQYGETDYAFICRLMEEEGIYFYFEHEDGKVKLVLADSISAHSPIPKHANIDFQYRDGSYRRKDDHIFEWADGAGVTSGKVTIDDYDFTSPKKDLKAVKTIAKGTHAHKNYELYGYPGKVRTEGTGDTFARVKMESEAVKHLTSRGVGNVRGLRVGSTFKLKEHPRVKPGKNDFLIIKTVHLLQIETDYEDEESQKSPFNPGNSADFGEDNKDTYRCSFSVIPKSEPYRAEITTPWPEIAGMHTAVVTGPSGEEIYTDKYGRIKVQFHWDRLGKKDENTTCWVRVVMPWTGKSWGMISIPRIGQEVAIQFEEGDPDRPICTGMFYNADTMPPYELPANMTMTGMTTRSTKGGSASTHHELVFEDKKGSEYVRFQSERDYLQVVKNNALVNIGGGHKDKGDLTQFVNRNKTEVVGEVRTHVTGMLEDLTVGLVYDEAVGVAKSETIGVYKEETVGLTMPSLDNVVEDVIDLAITIGGPISTLAYGGKYADIGAVLTATNSLRKAAKPGKKTSINGTSELIVTGDRIERISKSKAPAIGKAGDMKTFVEDGNQIISVLKGDRQVGVEKGDLITGVDKGDYKTTVAKGDMNLSIKKGKVKIDAKKSIELKVGSNSIKIDNTGITLKGAMIKNEAKSLFKADAKMTTVSGKMTMIDGKMVLIN